VALGKDEAVVVGLVLAFATWTTAHVAIAWGLLTARRGREAGAALVLAPAAPGLAWRAGLRGRAAVWVVAAAAYGAFRVAAS
jgi:hypothetical protein